LKRVILPLLMVLWIQDYFGQDMAGVAGSTRSPVNTIFINPSSIVDSRAFIDINIVGFSVFARNNLAYLPGGSLSRTQLEALDGPGIDLSRNNYRAYADVMVQGPSVTFNVKKHAFGLITNFRTVADARGIDNILGNYLINGFQYQPQMGQVHESKNLRTHALAWAETGITYGTIISRRGDMITQGAISVKRLWGVSGVGARIDNWRYIVADSNRLESFDFIGEYGFNDVMSSGFNLRNGSGFGVDLGVTFKRRFKSSEGYTPFDPCTDGDYRFKFGFSLLDVGRVRFNRPTYRNIFNESEQSQWNDFSNTQIDDLQQIDSLFTQGLGAAQNNSDALPFTMMLPATISAQIDYNWGKGFYTFGMINIGLPWQSRLGIQRSSLLAVVPRYEIKRFEFALPVTMYEFTTPLVGASLRLNSIIIGSDDLLALLFKRDIYGADFYFALKITMFEHWKCRPAKQKKAPKRRAQSFEPVPCPSW